MLYKIDKITDLNNKKKTDSDSVSRIGRILSVNPSEIKIGKSNLLRCVSPNYLKSFITTPVKSVNETRNGLIIITQNSVYYFIEIGDDDS